MYRFFVMIWNAADERQASVAQALSRRLLTSSEWSCVLDQSGLTIHHAGARPGTSESSLLPDRCGAILGTLFRREADGDSVPRRAVLTASDAISIVATHGLHLVRHYWGRYVAVLHEPTSGSTSIVRDPSGALPCLYTSHKGVTILFSDAEDLLALELGF